MGGDHVAVEVYQFGAEDRVVLLPQADVLFQKIPLGAELISFGPEAAVRNQSTLVVRLDVGSHDAGLSDPQIHLCQPLIRAQVQKLHH